MTHDEDAPTHWIAIAAEVEPVLAATPREKRRQILETAAKRFGRRPQTLRRMVKALRFVTTRAKAVGLAVEDVRAPVVCLEVWERMEKVFPDTHLDMRRQVLLGQHSFRDLLRLEQTMRRERDGPARAGLSDWPSFVAGVVADLSLGNDWTPPIGRDKKLHSPTARKLMVDLEFRVGNKESGALFLSPRIVFSESRGRTTADVLPRAATALFFYARVVYLAWDGEERFDVERYFADAPRRDEIGIEVVAFTETPFGAVAGAAYGA